jgi:hypothetical protein
MITGRKHALGKGLLLIHIGNRVNALRQFNLVPASLMNDSVGFYAS